MPLMSSHFYVCFLCIINVNHGLLNVSLYEIVLLSRKSALDILVILIGLKGNTLVPTLLGNTLMHTLLDKSRIYAELC